MENLMEILIIFLKHGAVLMTLNARAVFFLSLSQALTALAIFHEKYFDGDSTLSEQVIRKSGK